MSTDRLIITLVLTLTVGGCATVEDVNKTSDMLRLDNELTAIINGQDSSNMSLDDIASEAINHAEQEKNAQNKVTAISYYRIAATALWQSDSSNSSQKLWATASEGETLCNELGENAPDRDCLYLKLVTRFAAIEEAAAGRDYDTELNGVTFTDGSSPTEINTLDEAAKYLRTIKSPTDQVIEYGSEPALVTHVQLRKYYCQNIKQIHQHYRNTGALLLTKTRGFYVNTPEAKPTPVNDEDKVKRLRDIKPVPAVCD